MTHPLGGTTEDAERWWQAWQADTGQAGELRRRAEAGNEHARQFLAGNPDRQQLLAEPRD